MKTVMGTKLYVKPMFQFYLFGEYDIIVMSETGFGSDEWDNPTIGGIDL